MPQTVFIAPEYFPGIEWLIPVAGASSCWITPFIPYRRQTYHNRTRIRTPDGTLWLTVPVKKMPSGTSIRDQVIDYSTSWVQDHLKGLRYNYSTAPYFEHYESTVRDLLTGGETQLGKLTAATTLWCLRQLGIETLVQEMATSTEEFRAVWESGKQEKVPFIHPTYRQNFPGFYPGMSALDLLFNHGPEARSIVKALAG